MKVYYLDVTSFTQVGTSWRSPVIDLYYNSSYTNYSSTKSKYGSNALGNNTWTGLVAPSSTYDSSRPYDSSDPYDQSSTPYGGISNGRWVDTTGQVNLVSYSVNLTATSGSGSVPYTLDVYTSDKSTSVFSTEWAVNPGLLQTDGINMEDVPRYVTFVLNCTPPVGMVYTPELLVRVEIGAPAIFAYFQETQKVLDKFPEWMAIRELDNTGATPVSLGGQLINVFGGYLDDDLAQLTNLDYQRFIDTVDLSQMAWCYKASLPAGIDPVYIYGDKTELTRTGSQREFSESTATEDTCYWDENAGIIYTNKLYSIFQVNDVTYAQTQHQVWNYVDELGALVDLQRLPGESNDSFRWRIKDVYINGVGPSFDSFKKTLRRELNIWSVYNATPDSSYLGATPEILGIPDIEATPSYFTPDGLPTDRMKALVDKLSYDYPTTWGRFLWDESVWDTAGPDYEGYSTLSNQFDATPIVESFFQPGVGDGDDLKVYRPDTVLGPHSFRAQLVLRGKESVPTQQYPAIDLQVNVWGEGTRQYYQNPAQLVWLTLVLIGADGKQYYSSFQVQVQSDVDYNQATPSPSSYAVVPIFNNVGMVNPDFALIDPITGTNQYVSLSLPYVRQIKLYGGQWDVSNQSFIDGQTSATYQAWFDATPSSYIAYGGNATPTLYGDATPTTMPQANLVVESLVSNLISGTWQSPIFAYDIKLNGAPPALAATPYHLSLPNIAWDPYTGSDKHYVVELATQSGSTNEVNNLLGADAASFETLLGGWVAADTNTTLSRSNSWSYTGSWCMQLTSMGAGDISAQSLPTPVVAGQYTVSAVVNRPSGTGRSVAMQLHWFDAAYNELSISTGSSVTESSGSAVVVSTSAAAPLDAAYVAVRIVVTGTAGGEVHQVDEVRLYDNSANPISQLPTFGGYTVDADGNPLFLNYSYFAINSSTAWTNGNRLQVVTPVGQGSSNLGATPIGPYWVNLSTVSGSDYPIMGKTWQYFEALQATPFSGLVDENGPWNNSLPPSYGNTNFQLTQANLTRSDFNLSNTSDYIPLSLGINILDDPQVTAWVDNNVIKPATPLSGLTYPSGAIQESIVNGVYKYSPFVVWARLKNSPTPQWNPLVNSGYYYDEDDEYYFYAQPLTETLTATPYTLSQLARQGAPIIVQAPDGHSLREVCFFDSSATPDYNYPTTLTLTNTETLNGNGTSNLYLAYDNVTVTSVTDLTSGQSVTFSAHCPNNVVALGSITDSAHQYQVQYIVVDSYLVNNESINGATPATSFQFATPPSPSTPYTITYEGSILNPATPVDINLSPLYSTIGEGFIFLSNTEYSLTDIYVYITPGTINADGQDYGLVTFRTVDEYDNPKPNVLLNLSTTWGTLSTSTVTTNDEGFAYATLYSVVANSVPSNVTPTVTAKESTTGITGSSTFDVALSEPTYYQILVQPNTMQVLADGNSQVMLYGNIKDLNYQPVAYPTVNWVVARNTYDLFATSPLGERKTGTVTGDVDGNFVVGPFTAETVTGYWLAMVESSSAYGGVTYTQTGDITYWYELTPGILEDETGIPYISTQYATPSTTIPRFDAVTDFPVLYAEDGVAPATPVTPVWVPPKWYAISRYTQYQMGLLGTGTGVVSPTYTTNLHPSNGEI